MYERRPSKELQELERDGLLDVRYDFRCMWCDRDCSDSTDLVHTDDEETLEGFEYESYCPDCDDSTFHRLTVKEECIRDPRVIKYFQKHPNDRLSVFNYLLLSSTDSK